MQLAFQRLCISHNDCSNGKSWETTSSVEGMSSCKCNIIVSACVAFIAQSVAGCHSFLVSLATRGFSPVEFEEAVVKAKGLLIKSAQDYYYCDCFALLLQLRGQEALQWQSERHESVLVPRDIHLSQVWLPLLYYYSLLIHLIFRQCRTTSSSLASSFGLLKTIKHHEPHKKVS